MKTLQLKATREAQIIPLLPDKVGHQESQASKAKLLFVRNADAIYSLIKSEINFIKSSGNYSEIHLMGGHKILSAKTLKHYQGLLDTPQFIRVHQSYLVNRELIAQFNFKGGSTILMRNEVIIPVSRQRQAETLSFLQN